MPLLTKDDWRKLFCQAVDRAIPDWSCQLVAFVVMPEHAHLLVLPTSTPVRIDRLPGSIKQPDSGRSKNLLMTENSPLLDSLMVQERPGKVAFRYWQEGPGDDRNLSTESVVMAAINDIHWNPVRRGLVDRAMDWKWSSAMWYFSDTTIIDPDLPRIDGLPWTFFK